MASALKFGVDKKVTKFNRGTHTDNPAPKAEDI